jgi:tetratricopeptide (TPR) repeat protein
MRHELRTDASAERKVVGSWSCVTFPRERHDRLSGVAPGSHRRCGRTAPSCAASVEVVTTAPRESLHQFRLELEEYPDQRGEILLDIAHTHRTLGEFEPAEAIMREMIAEGGEDGDYARVSLAELLFDLGRDAEARAELAALKAGRRTDRGGWQLAAELFEERGELSEALTWYTMATERFTAGERSRLDSEYGWSTPAGMLVRGRRGVRRGMGLPPDGTDALVPDENEIQRLFLRPMSTIDEAMDTMRARRDVSAEVRMLFWPRTEFDAAVERWPDLLKDQAAAAHYYPDLEQKLSVIAAEGAHRVSLVPCEVDGLVVFLDQAGSDDADSAARRAYLETRHRDGHYVSWPPERNKPCWCGSAVKYKKCCGAPAR